MLPYCIAPYPIQDATMNASSICGVNRSRRMSTLGPKPVNSRLTKREDVHPRLPRPDLSHLRYNKHSPLDASRRHRQFKGSLRRTRTAKRLRVGQRLCGEDCVMLDAEDTLVVK